MSEEKEVSKINQDNTLKKKKATYRPFIRPDKPIIDSYIKAIDSIKL